MINNVVLIGRLTKDVELRQTNNNNQMVSFTLAVNRPFKGQDGTQQTDFINCKAFNKTAQNIARYCGRGSLVAVHGSIQTGSYPKKDGTTAYTTDVMVNQIAFLESKPQGNQQQGNNFNQPYNNVNNAYNSFDNQNKVNALDYINQANSVQNNGNTGQFNQQQQMQINGTGGINNTNTLYTDFGNDYNLDDMFENVINPFKQE